MNNLKIQIAFFKLLFSLYTSQCNETKKKKLQNLTKIYTVKTTRLGILCYLDQGILFFLRNLNWVTKSKHCPPLLKCTEPTIRLHNSKSLPWSSSEADRRRKHSRTERLPLAATFNCASMKLHFAAKEQT